MFDIFIQAKVVRANYCDQLIVNTFIERGKSKMDFKEAIDLARKIIKRFEKIEGKPWGAEGAIIELTKQAGELSKSIMVYEGYYFRGRGKLDKRYIPAKGKIGDELADILYAIIRIADHYRIDLEQAHIKARLEEDKFLKTKGV